MHQHGLDEHLLNGEARIERGVGILKYDLHSLAKRQHFIGRQMLQVIVSKTNGSGSGINQFNYGTASGGLATSRFTNQAQRLPAMNLEVNTIDGLHKFSRAGPKTFAHGEMHREVAHLKQRFLILRHFIFPGCLRLF